MVSGVEKASFREVSGVGWLVTRSYMIVWEVEVQRYIGIVTGRGGGGAGVEDDGLDLDLSVVGGW